MVDCRTTRVHVFGDDTCWFIKMKDCSQRGIEVGEVVEAEGLTLKLFHTRERASTQTRFGVKRGVLVWVLAVAQRLLKAYGNACLLGYRLA